MRVNPVYKRETRVNSRSFRLPLILLVFNGILALVALLNMYSTLAQVRITAEVQYSSFLDLYAFVAVLEFVMLILIMPSITAGSISGERERQTLELMLTTKMSPAQIVFGKLAASCSTMLLLVISSLPVLAMVFVYGGVTIQDILLLFLCYITVMLFSGGIGICCSAWLKKSTLATVVSYVIIGLVLAGTYGANQFALYMSKMNADSYMTSIGSVASQGNSGGCLYLLLLNPAATFLLTMFRMSGADQSLTDISRWFGEHSQTTVIENWVVISIVVQLVLAAVLMWGAVQALKPKRQRER